jgi:RNA polymerase sigma-70 factor (ECF subfamily)
MSDPTEEAGDTLLVQARGGDGEALGRLLERYRAYLTLLARVQIGRRLQGKVDAADVVQDAFLEAHRHFGQFQGQTEPVFVRWLRGVLAGNLAHLVRRYCKTRGRNVGLEQALVRELDSSSDVLENGLVADGSTPSEQAARREQALLLAAALEKLPADYREVILLRQMDGLSFADVAARMARTEDSVQKLWVRALDRLRQVLDSPH